MRSDLDRTITSVTAQTFDNYEYIIIDGGSTDGSTEVIAAHIEALDQWVSEPDRGIYDAMNKGAAIARGEWVLFLNSGDCFSNHEVLAKIFSDPLPIEADFLVGDALVNYPDGPQRLWRASPPEDIIFGMICSHQALFARRQLLNTTRFTTGKSASDYELLLRSWIAGKQFHYLGIIVAAVTAGGLSDRQRVGSIKQQWILLRNANKLTPRLIGYLALKFVSAAAVPCLKRLLPPTFVRRMRRWNG